MSSIKYIGTKIDNKSAIMGLSTCNMCPFLYFESHSKSAFCKNPREEHLTKKHIMVCYSYMYNDGYHYPLNEVSIPDWCQLSNMVVDILGAKKISYQDSGDVHTDTITSFGEFHIYADKKLKFKGCKLETKFAPDNKDNTTTQKSLPERTTYSAPIPVVKKEVCSLCGESKEDVDRTKKLGMCEKCWKKISKKKDNDKIYFAYMNNFRLKRKSTYSESDFKKIVNNIKL